MKKSLSFVISAICALAALQAFAASQSPTAAQKTAPPVPAQQPEDVSTSGRNLTAQDGRDLIPPLMLDRQGIVSWGAATQPGPRNEHVTLPHGGPIGVGDRTNVPGRE